MEKKKITIVSPCFNEAENIPIFFKILKNAISRIDSNYDFEILFVDNASTDESKSLLLRIAKENKNVKLIFNRQNYGSIRSSFHGLLNAEGDAAILISVDLQEPVEMIGKFITEWSKGNKIVAGIKIKTEETGFLPIARSIYYRALQRLSEVPVEENFFGFALYDRVVLDDLRKNKKEIPFLRLLVSDLGYSIVSIPFTQRAREIGKSKNSLFDLLDIASIGISSYSILPLRLISIVGVILSVFSLLAAILYVLLKILFWDYFSLGIAPLIIGFFFLFGFQLLSLGIIAEYIGAIQRAVNPRAPVLEELRVNFD